MTLKDEMVRKNHGRNVSASPPFPLKLKIDICDKCNHNCIFCPTGVQDRRQGNIDDKLCRRLIREGYDAGARELAFSATGEPLLNRYLEEYVSIAKHTGYEYVFINTNGALLNKERTLSLLSSGVDSVKISINAGNAQTYRLIHGADCFRKVIDNIIAFDRLRKEIGSKCKLYVSFVAVKENMNQAEVLRFEIADYIDDFIISNANTRGGGVSGEIENSLLGIDDYSFQFPCGQLFDTMVILAEGYLVICCQDFDKSSVIADLNEITMQDAWNCKKFIDFRKQYLNKKLTGTLCFNCLLGREETIVPLTPNIAHYPISQCKVDDRDERIKILRDLY
jgi:wyosine [tRNA(Phe)-imidazoG37] synthetase (radical SAM superfamily)